MLFGVDNAVYAASNSLRGTSEQELVPASVAPPTNRNLIIGGNIAEPNEYPYFAHFEGIACGGSLIAKDIVLTAGHVSFEGRQSKYVNIRGNVSSLFSTQHPQCKLLSPKDYGQVHVGRHDYRNGGRQDGVELFHVENHFRHPDYVGQLCCGYHDGVRFNGVSYDFLLLKLGGESTKQVVTLETSATVPSTDQELTLMGFG